MSFLKGTNVELIAACAVAGTAISNSATAGVLNSADGAAYLPIGFFNGQLYRTVNIRASGIYSSPASAPATMQLGVTLNTSQGSIGSLTILSGAITPTVSMSSALWDLDLEITASTYTETSGSGTVNVMGIGTLALHNSTTTTAGAVYGIGGTSLVSAVTYTGYFLEVYGKFGSAVSGSTVTGERTSVYGCN
jgi:hypothetical protein